MKKEYLQRLKTLCDQIENKFAREIFYFICKKYQQSLVDPTVNKNCTKEEIILHLINMGLMNMSIDKNTKEEKLPDDRQVRKICRQLIKIGIPILSSSMEAGYFICDDTSEIVRPFKENHSRALNILAVEKGYKKMSGFVSGQINMLDTTFQEENLDDDLV